MFAGKPGESPAFALKDKYFFAKTHCNKTTSPLSVVAVHDPGPQRTVVRWRNITCTCVPRYHQFKRNELGPLHSTEWQDALDALHQAPKESGIR